MVCRTDPLFLSLKKEAQFPLHVYPEKPGGSEPEYTQTCEQNRTNSELKSAESPSEVSKNLLNLGPNRFLSVGGLSVLMRDSIT